MKENALQILLGLNIAHFLTLTNTFKLCKKASQKLHAMTRISSYLNKLKLLMNTFFRPSLDIFHLSGYSAIEDITIRETVYRNGCLE